MDDRQRITTTMDLNLYREIGRKGIPLSHCIDEGARILLGDKNLRIDELISSIEINENRIDSLEDTVSMLLESLKDLKRELGIVIAEHI